jgi:hypothetical protein
LGRGLNDRVRDRTLLSSVIGLKNRGVSWVGVAWTSKKGRLTCLYARPVLCLSSSHGRRSSQTISLLILLEPLHMVIDNAQDDFELSNTESTGTVGLVALCQFLLNVLDHLFADTDAVILVLDQGSVHMTEGLDATLSLLSLDLLFLGDGDINLNIAVAYSMVDDAKTAEVGGVAAANSLEPLEGFLAQEIAGGGVEDEHAVVEIQGHKLRYDGRAGVHEGGRGLGAGPGWAQEAEIDWPLGAATVELVVDLVSNLNWEIEEAGPGWAQEAEIDWPLGAATVELVVDLVSNLNWEIEEADGRGLA